MEIKNKHLLYVEDDEGLARLFQKHMERHGYKVDLAYTGLAGMEKYNTGSYDVAILDYRLPDFNALELLESQRRQDINIPIIILTALGDEKVAVEAMRLGAADYIVKDVNQSYLELLPAVIESTIGKAGLVEQTKSQQKQVEFYVGELEKKNRALAESEERLSALLENSSEVNLILEADGTCKFVSPAIKRLFGYSPAELVGKNFLDFIREKERKTAAKKLQKLKEKPLKTLTSLMTFLHKDGNWRIVECTERNLIEDAAVNGIVANFHDITEKVLTTERLRLSQERFDLAVQGTNDGIWDWNIAAGEIYYSPRCKEILGYEDSEIANDIEIWQKLVHPEDKSLALDLLYKYLGGELQNYNVRFRMRHKDGSWKWIMSRGKAIRDANGKAIRMIGAHTDITRDKETELQLIKNEERLKLFITYTPAAIAMLDSQMRYIMVSKRWLESYGLQEENIIGKSHLEIFPDMLEKWQEVYKRCLAGAVEKCDEDEFIRTDGKMDWVKWEIHPWYKEDNAIGGIIMFTEVITEAKLARQNLAAYSRELEVERDKAEAANRAKSEFLANMSHEIRTPMNAVIGLANILSTSRPLTEKQQEFVDTLLLSSHSLMSLINDLLDIAKIETNNIDLESIVFNLEDLLKEVMEVSRLRAEDKGIYLNLEMDPGMPKFYSADPLRIRQVITNLVANAVKFTEKGGVLVHAVFNSGDSNVLISVKDTGIGIAENQQKIIFEKFTQADASMTRKYGGTGLGLAISKNLAEILGGEISLKSRLGKGSEFIISLPLEPAEEIRSQDETPANEPKIEVAEVTQRGQVLLVEDYKANVMVATSMLDQLGYSYIIAHDGLEAVEKVKNGGDFFAVLMDVQMPRLDGLEATRRIRLYEKEKGLKHSPIIAMTAHAMTGDRERCLESGMDDYISKPFNPSELAEKLERFKAEDFFANSREDFLSSKNRKSY